MKITTRKADQYHEPGPYEPCGPDCHREYDILADGRETGY